MKLSTAPLNQTLVFKIHITLKRNSTFLLKKRTKLGLTNLDRTFNQVILKFSKVEFWRKLTCILMQVDTVKLSQLWLKDLTLCLSDNFMSSRRLREKENCWKKEESVLKKLKRRKQQLLQLFLRRLDLGRLQWTNRLNEKRMRWQRKKANDQSQQRNQKLFLTLKLQIKRLIWKLKTSRTLKSCP